MVLLRVTRWSLPTLFGWAIRHLVNYSRVCRHTRPAPSRAGGAGRRWARSHGRRRRPGRPVPGTSRGPRHTRGTRSGRCGGPRPHPLTSPPAGPPEQHVRHPGRGRPPALLAAAPVPRGESAGVPARVIRAVPHTVGNEVTGSPEVNGPGQGTRAGKGRFLVLPRGGSGLAGDTGGGGGVSGRPRPPRGRHGRDAVARRGRARQGRPRVRKRPCPSWCESFGQGHGGTRVSRLPARTVPAPVLSAAMPGRTPRLRRTRRGGL